MKVVTIIVTYNALKKNWLYKCVDSLLNSNLETEIIIIDNASTDETCSIIREKYKQIILIENKENKGFGAANNQGFEYAIKNHGDYFFLLNQDAWVEPNTIQNLVEQAKNNPEYGILSPLHLNGNGNALDYNFSNYITPHFCKNLYSDFVLNKVTDKIYESGFICAAAWMITRKCLEKVGGFSPTFFHYGEDDNYIHRLNYKKLKIGVNPMVKIFHDREDRSSNQYEKDHLLKERRYFLSHSNPQVLINIDKEIKQFERKILKRKIVLDFKTAKAFEKEIIFSKKHQVMIEKNLKASMSDKSFIFLSHK